jgi:hypothetical protein
VPSSVACPSSLQTAINGATNGTTLNLTGCSFTVSATVGVANRTDLTIVGGSVKATGYFPVFKLDCDTRVTLRGWKITGTDTTPGAYLAGREDGHGIHVNGGTGITVAGVSVDTVQGDGIYLGQCGTTNGDGMTITDFSATNFDRMGIAVVAFNNVHATGLTMSNAGYRYLDVEPDCNGSYAQQARGITFEQGTFGGWLRKDADGTLYGTSWLYIGTPSCGGGFVPQVSDITVRGFTIDTTNDRSPHYSTAVQPAGYRVARVTIDGNTERDLIWSNNCSSTDVYALTNNRYLAGVRSGYLVAQGCTNVTETGNTTQ